ncbi:hypothetical protein RRG08_002845 [Elysia crispata]|uniref:Uncharacterized protein n=1 Tax=Elysia crispata TaxID=231223 RepID=A0AAE0XUD1_9GAST|nr:hypothetical protein RRG08_002845 [Elysia crispata]
MGLRQPILIAAVDDGIAPTNLNGGRRRHRHFLRLCLNMATMDLRRPHRGRGQTKIPTLKAASLRPLELC